jgi:predicted flap endonuclease-1-like 5' DNA nuclease
MNKNNQQNFIAWISVLLGAISSLLLVLILWKDRVQKLTTPSPAIPKIKLPEDDENPQLPALPLTKIQPKLPRSSKPTPHGDDLKKIEGIGPKIAQILNDNQINTFSRLSSQKADDLRKILTQAHLRLADPTTWPEQAAYAAKQDWEGLKTFQNKLKGGRRES